MSPNPGEVGHDEHGWTHAICASCWVASHPGRTPVTITADEPVPCCYCGQPTSAGIYTRGDPKAVHA